MIPIYKPEFHKDTLQEVKKVLDSGILATGLKTRELEEKFADFVGAKYAIGVNSCTSALLLGFSTLQKGVVVKIPSVTFASVVNMAIKAKLKVSWDDKIYVGKAYEMNGIWDSAHELSRGCFPGGIACYSFYPTKNLPSAEGGMIATDDKDLYEFFLKMRNNGIVREGYDWDYSVDLIGWKCAMNDIQAAIALVQLKHLDETLERRRKVRDYYNNKLSSFVRSLHIFGLLIDNREDLMRDLKAEGIGYSVNFKPNHLHPAYKNIKKASLGVSEYWGKHQISLPYYPSLTEEDIDKVCKIVNKYH